MKCTECPDYIKCQRNYDLRSKRHRCLKAKEPKVYTNADHIRSLPDEELAKVIMCPYGNDHNSCVPGSNCLDCCLECCLEWLQQPCEDSPTVEKG